jgi:hypothetical protein
MKYNYIYIEILNYSDKCCSSTNFVTLFSLSRVIMGVYDRLRRGDIQIVRIKIGDLNIDA